jgi:hypothetical protein
MKDLLRKLVLAVVFSLLNFSLFAPAMTSLAIIDHKPVEPFRILINAIGKVETGFDTLAYNPLEEATGFFQIRPIRLEDYNARTGSNYSMEDMYNYFIAEKIFLYYASKIGPYDFETISRNWNGSGPMTIEYWKKVRANL